MPLPATQVSYRITTPDDTEAELLLDQYTVDSGTANLFVEAARRLVIDRNQRNPRRIKRFLNSFVLLYALDPDWKRFGPQRLVEVLLLDTHFAELMALLRAGSEVDPVSELLDHRGRRAAVLADDHDVPLEERLRELERTLPEQFPLLVENTELMALVESLHSSEQWVDVCYKLQRRTRPVTTQVPSDPGGSVLGAEKSPLASAGSALLPKVLWIGAASDNDLLLGLAAQHGRHPGARRRCRSPICGRAGLRGRGHRGRECHWPRRWLRRARRTA
jgi:hypothetical protein